MSLDLQVYPIEDMGISTPQKSRIPLKFFPEGLLCGTPSVLKTTCGEYIVRVFPLDLDGCMNCYIEPSVTLINKKYQEPISTNCIEYLTEVVQVETKNDYIQTVAVHIVLNDQIFKYVDKITSAMEDLIRDVLEPYYLMTNCCINLDKETKSFGISNVILTAPSSRFVFRIGPNTKIVIEDVKMERDKSIYPSELEGIESYIKELDDIIHSLKIYRNLKWKVKPSLNALIIGPTGCGKTSLCHNFLCKYSCNVFVIKPSDIIRQYPGETEEVIRNIFRKATICAENFKTIDPTVIFVENVEILCPSKIESQDSAHINRICGQFCSLLDEIYIKNSQVIVLGTCTTAEMINSAIRRPGRFEKEISLAVLNPIQRERIFNLILQKSCWKINEDVCGKLASYMAKCTPGYVAGDILLLLQCAAQKEMETLRKESMNQSLYSHLKESLLSALKSIKPTSIRGSDVSVYRSDQTFENIGGMNDLKRTLQVSVLAGLKHPEAFQRFGLHLPKGILLYGPPGCGKTTIAKCLATEAKMTLISTSAAEVYSPYVGNAEKFISKIFDVARKNAPCLLFLDEIDSLVGNRSITSKSDVQTRVLSTLLTEIDGIGLKIHSGISYTFNNLLVVAATNRPDMVDNALMRPGRFDKLIHVPPPDRISRINIFSIFKSKMPFHQDVDIEFLADKTNNFSSADICNLCNEAAMCAFTEDFNTISINEKHFMAVLQNLNPSLTEKQVNWYQNFERKYIS